MPTYIYKDELYHYGIRGQKWGVKNGPPYPLSGGDYTQTEWKALKAERKKKYSRYNKAHYDQVIKEGTRMQTLARDPNRTKNTDMFYAAYTKADKDRYNAMFNHKTPQTLYDENGNEIGTGKTYKWSIENVTKCNIKVASKDSGAKAVMNLYKNSRDFMNFVQDPSRLQNQIKNMYIPGKHKYIKVLDKFKDPNFIPKDKDLYTLYGAINSVIPSQDPDVVRQRTRLFNELKNNGYGAVLDVNDAFNNALTANSPVIVFDTSAYVQDKLRKTTMVDVYKSKLTTAGRVAIGIYDNGD